MVSPQVKILLGQAVPISCKLCPRLVAHREEIGRVQRRAYLDQEYWSKPIPGFGDPAARLLIIGLAPGAHGANRTGRIFTGDRSGDFLYRALYEAGFAINPPASPATTDSCSATPTSLRPCAVCRPTTSPPSKRSTPAAPISNANWRSQKKSSSLSCSAASRYKAISRSCKTAAKSNPRRLPFRPWRAIQNARRRSACSCLLITPASKTPPQAA